jgi:hypothetical protein
MCLCQRLFKNYATNQRLQCAFVYNDHLLVAPYMYSLWSCKLLELCIVVLNTASQLHVRCLLETVVEPASAPYVLYCRIILQYVCVPTTCLCSNTVFIYNVYGAHQPCIHTVSLITVTCKKFRIVYILAVVQSTCH